MERLQEGAKGGSRAEEGVGSWEGRGWGGPPISPMGRLFFKGFLRGKSPRRVEGLSLHWQEKWIKSRPNPK